MNKVIAVIVTIVVGYLGTSILGNLLNWPDAGAICAIATMGVFIWNALEHKETGEDNSSEDNK